MGAPAQIWGRTLVSCPRNPKPQCGVVVGGDEVVDEVVEELAAPRVVSELLVPVAAGATLVWPPDPVLELVLEPRPEPPLDPVSEPMELQAARPAAAMTEAAEI